MTQGKCTRCKIKYIWKDHTQRLCDSVCIYCGTRLLMTSCQLGRGVNGQVYKHIHMTPKIDPIAEIEKNISDRVTIEGFTL